MTALRSYWPVMVQVAGITLVSVGFGLLAVWAGLVTGGLGLVLLGVAAEVGRQ